MPDQQLHLSSTAPWRALLTHAQFIAGVQLSSAVEAHLVHLLLRSVGSELLPSALGEGLSDRIDRVLGSEVTRPTDIGDQCLLLAGLYPEYAIRRAVPVAYFVEVGRNAYRDHAARHHSALHEALADEFVHTMDALQTVRAMHSGEPCIDGFNAFNLWHELGSAHGWRVLRSMSTAIPVSGGISARLH